MKLHLIRHGMTIANEKRLYCGWTDVGLSERGRAELDALKLRCAYPAIDGLRVITSGMRRTDETLELLYGRAPDRREPAFREMHFGEFEMHSYDELKHDPAYQAWIMDEGGEVCTPGGESSAGFRARVLHAFAQVDCDAAIFCHGGVIAAIMQALFPEEGRNLYQWQPGHGCGYTLVLQGEARSFAPFPIPET